MSDEITKKMDIEGSTFTIEITSHVLRIVDSFGKIIGRVTRTGVKDGIKDLVYKMEFMPWYSDNVGEHILEALEDYWGVK